MDDSHKKPSIPTQELGTITFYWVSRLASHGLSEKAKTPWAHDIDHIWFLFVTGENEMELRKALGISIPCSQKAVCAWILTAILGQIANYMRAFKIRFAFITTYEWAMCIKQEMQDGDIILYVSAPIRHRCSAYAADQLHHDHVVESTITVRRVLLYLQSLSDISLNKWSFDNPMSEGLMGENAPGANVGGQAWPEGEVRRPRGSIKAN